MLPVASNVILLACVTSLLLWPLLQVHTRMYRGCAYRAVAGKEQALWFCLADNLCAMFYCQDNNIFSVDDCGCVPPHRRKAHGHHHHHHHDHGNTANSGAATVGGGGGGGGGVDGGGGGGGKVPGRGGHGGDGDANLVTMTTVVPPPSARTTASIAFSPSSAGGMPSGNDGTSSGQKPDSNCQQEIQINGLTVKTPLGSGANDVYIEPRGVTDMGNGSAFYDGYSYLAVPMYTNAGFNSGVTVDFILEEGTSTLRQVLMTNCKHGQGASLEIVLDVELGVIVFHIMYRFREAVNQVESVLEVAVPYTAFSPKRVAMVFDGHTLRGRVNSSERSATVRGTGDFVVAQRAKPLLFGNTMCDVDDVYSFRGQIKQISVYRCVKDITQLFS